MDPEPTFTTPFVAPQNPLAATLSDMAPDSPLSDLPAIDPRNIQAPDIEKLEQEQARLKAAGQPAPPAAAPAPPSPAVGAGLPAPATNAYTNGYGPPSTEELIAELQRRQISDDGRLLETEQEARSARQAIQLLALSLAIAGAVLLLYALKQKQLEQATIRATMGIGE